MAFELPLGSTTTNEANLLTKIPNALNALRDGGAFFYGGSTGNVVSGTNDAMVLTTDVLSPPHTSYIDGLKLTIRPPTAFSLSAVPTLNLDGLGVVVIKKLDAQNVLGNLDPSDITNGANIIVSYYSVSNVFILHTLPPRFSSKNMGSSGLLTASLAPGGVSFLPAAIGTHDNVQVLVMAGGDDPTTAHLWSVTARRPDGLMVSFFGFDGLFNALPAIPSSGSVNFAIKNHGASQIISVRYSIMRITPT